MSVYLSGHDHILEHLAETDGDFTTNYVINGAADYLLNKVSNKHQGPEGSVKYYWTSSWQIRGAVVFIKASQKRMSVDFFKSNGNLLHQILIQPNLYPL